MGRIVLVEGDITEQSVDAIVNAANTDLILGSGVAGAIREKGGHSIALECEAHGPVRLGGAVWTRAGELPARFVIHAAAMEVGGVADEASVRGAVCSSFEVAVREGYRSLALPAVGAGVGGFSLQRCAEISLAEARRQLAGESPLEEIRFVLWGEPAFRVFEMVQDAAKVADQMERMGKRSR